MQRSGLSLIFFIGSVFLFNTANCQSNANPVVIIGNMKDVMWKGETSAKINLDTIHNKEHLYAIGPVENLQGEIMVIDGKSYKASLATDSTEKLEENIEVKAPLLAYSRVKNWKEIIIPDSIKLLNDLENFIGLVSKHEEPFIFRVTGTIHAAMIHVTNLPQGVKITSPEDAHTGQVNFTIYNSPSEMVGFYSTKHQGIFTHHDTNIHIHVLTNDKKLMGHLDYLLFKLGTAKLYLPAD